MRIFPASWPVIYLSTLVFPVLGLISNPQTSNTKPYASDPLIWSFLFGGDNCGGDQWTTSFKPYSECSESSPGDQCEAPASLLNEILLSKLFLSNIKLF